MRSDPTIIVNTIAFVKAQLAGTEAGHDWFHIERVLKTARAINRSEGGETLVIELAALLHDIADPKFHNGDESLGPEIAGNFLREQRADMDTIEHVLNIIRCISFKQSFEPTAFDSLELRIVRDADRLDAIGAIGIARAFTYGGFKNRLLYDPAVPPAQFKDKEAYKNATGHTINHFYEKLLRLKDLMTTEAGKKLAADRHRFMENYLEQFYNEWEGLV